MKGRPLALLALAVVLLGIAAILLLRMFAGPRIDLNPYQALGTVAAEEAARLCSGKGRVVLVIPDPGSDPDPVLDAQLAAFRATLKKQGGVEIKATEKIRMDPFLRMQTGGAVPPDQYVALRTKHADAAALVLFIGFPPIAADAAGTGAPKVMVVSAALPGYEALLRQQVLALAIVPKPMNAEVPSTPPTSTREAFDREYTILRAPAAE